MDTLEAIFLFCFVFGLALSVFSFALGAFHLGGGESADGGHDIGGHDIGGHDLGDGGHAGDGSHASPAHSGGWFGNGPSPINVQTITAFMAFFGGAGYVFYGSFGVSAALALIFATLAGLIGGGMTFAFLVKVLLKGQRFLDPSDFYIEGTVARVSGTIREGGIGEIIFTKDGTRRSLGARGESGVAIPIGTEVVVTRYEKGIAYVEPWSSFVGDTA